MRSTAEPKTARRSRTPAPVRKVKVTNRKSQARPAKPGRELALPELKALQVATAVQVKPVSAKSRRIELINPLDDDDVAWAEAFAHAKQAAEHKTEYARRRFARRMQRLRLAVKYTALAAVCMGIGASANLAMMKAPEWSAALLGGKVDARVAEMAPGGETTVQPTGSIKPEAPAKKKVAMAHLTVDDAQGLADELIALPIRAEPAQPDQEIGVRLSGLPEDATLSSGKKLPDGSWLLKDGEEQDVKLKLARPSSGLIALAVEAVSLPDGENVSPMNELRVKVDLPKEDMAVVPTADSLRRNNLAKGPTPITSMTSPVPVRLAEATPQQPVPVPPPAEVKEPSSTSALLARGDALLQSGDMAGARLFYQRAFEQGNEKAAASVARTYDPEVFRQMKVMGLKPNPAKAQEWYVKAAEAGDTDSARRAAALQAVKP